MTRSLNHSSVPTHTKPGALQDTRSGLLAAQSPLDSGIVASEVKPLSRVRLCDPMDCSLPGSSIHGILQARVLEWVAISFSRGSSQPRDRTQVSCTAGRRSTVRATSHSWGSKCLCSPSVLAFYSPPSPTSTLHSGPPSPKQQLLKMDLRSPEKKPWVTGYPTFGTECPISLLEYWYSHHYSRNLCYLQFFKLLLIFNT